MPKTVTEKLINDLTYFNRETRKRHLFILSAGKDLSHKRLVKMPLTLTTGPRDNSSDFGTIIISQFNDLPEYQPSKILDQTDDFWTRERPHAFSYFSGKRNSRMGGRGGRRLRKMWEEERSSWNSTTVGGKPFHYINLNHYDFDKDAAYKFYQDSVFCPALPGDTSWQRRFYDVILNGCLPLVISWDTPSFPHGKSYFVPEGHFSMQMDTWSVSQTYPFASGLFPDELAIDYSSFVVEAPGNIEHIRDTSSVARKMEELLADREELKRRQLQMKEYALLFTMGVGEDAHRYEDEFARIIRTLRLYLEKIEYIKAEETTFQKVRSGIGEETNGLHNRQIIIKRDVVYQP